MTSVDWTRIAIAGAIAFLATLAGVPVARRIALRLGITDRPAQGKMHKRPTPYLGGLAIGIGALGAAIAANAGSSGWTRQVAAILAGGLTIAVVGLIDDLRNLSALVRLAVETFAAVLVVAAGVHVRLFDNPLDWVLTVVWIVILTNSFNLLDNMDGAAGSIGSITAIALVIAAALEGQTVVSSLGAVLAGACLGFLPYNWHPARIFMGDAGSLFLGYLLSVLGLALRFPTGRTASIVAVALLAGPCVFDTTLVVLSRRAAGRPITLGGTDHTSHRLLRLGLRIPGVTSTLALGTAAITGLGVVTGRGGINPWISLALAAGLGVALLAMLLRMPAYDLGPGRAPRTAAQAGP